MSWANAPIRSRLTPCRTSARCTITSGKPGSGCAHQPAVVAQPVGQVVERKTSGRGAGLERPAHGWQPAAAVVQHLERTEPGNLVGQVAGRFATGLLDLAIAFAPQPQKIIVLANHLPAGPRKIQGERRHVAPQVVDVKHKFPGQVGRLAPNDPAATQRSQAELVSRGIDRFNPRQAKIPFQLGLQKRGTNPPLAASTCTGTSSEVRLTRSSSASANFADRLVLAGERDAQRGHHANRVRIDSLEHFVRREQVAALLHRHFAEFDVEIPRTCASTPAPGRNQVGTLGRPPGGLLPGSPPPFEGQPGQHRGLA